MRQEHDAAHRIAVGILRLVASSLGEEERQRFYQNAMPLIVTEIQEYQQRTRREDSRLTVRIPETNEDCCPEIVTKEKSS